MAAPSHVGAGGLLARLDMQVGSQCGHTVSCFCLIGQWPRLMRQTGVCHVLVLATSSACIEGVRVPVWGSGGSAVPNRHWQVFGQDVGQPGVAVGARNRHQNCFCWLFTGSALACALQCGVLVARHAELAWQCVSCAQRDETPM